MTKSDLIQVPPDLVENVSNLINALTEATTIGQQGHFLNELKNEVDQLITWHPGYDYETGTIHDE